MSQSNWEADKMYDQLLTALLLVVYVDGITFLTNFNGFL